MNTYRDYRVMLVVVLAQVALYVLTSHLVAERRYRWAWDTGMIRRMIVFGWPLLINALLMFGIFQGDRAIVGGVFTMQALGLYSAAFGLLMMPSLIASRVLQSLLLPMLSGAKADEARFGELAAFATQLCLLGGVGFAAGTVWCGDDLLVLFYGDKYAPAVGVVGWLACMQGVRIARVGQSIAAIAKADTRNPMYANIARTLAIPIALGGAMGGMGVEWIAASGLAGELLAALWSQRLLAKRIGLPASPVILPALIGGALMSASFALAAIFGGRGGATPLDFVWASVAGLATLLGMIPCSPSLRHHLSDRLASGHGHSPLPPDPTTPVSLRET